MYSNKQVTVNQSGQSLMELIIVIAVMVIVIGALTFATIASLRNAQFAKNQVQATKLAQEGIEWVRTGRNRNACIFISGTFVNSWNSSNIACLGTIAIWDYPISGANSNFCESSQTSTKCYFKISPDGSLNNIAGFGKVFQKTDAEPIPHDTPVFYRVISLSDDASFASQKIVTAIVIWTDFSGSHESKLTTILRKI